MKVYQDPWYWLFIVDIWVLHVNGTVYRSAMLAKRNGRNGLEIGNILIYSGCLEVSRREVVWCKGQPSKMGALRATRSRAVSVQWVAFWAWRCSQKWAWWVNRDEALLYIVRRWIASWCPPVAAGSKLRLPTALSPHVRKAVQMGLLYDGMMISQW